MHSWKKSWLTPLLITTSVALDTCKHNQLTPHIPLGSLDAVTPIWIAKLGMPACLVVTYDDADAVAAAEKALI